MRPASVLGGLCSLFVLGLSVSYGQVPAKLAFEVASVRLVDPHSHVPVNGGLAEFNIGPGSQQTQTTAPIAFFIGPLAP